MKYFILLALLALPRVWSQQVALSFDDLPCHGPLPAGVTRADVARSVISTLRKAQAPGVLGLVNSGFIKDAESDTEVLRLWSSAGYPLGNHTASHMDLNTHSVPEFVREIEQNEAILRQYSPHSDWHWFRYPYLKEGDTAAKHDAVSRYLTDNGYRVAQVTLSFGDYAYHEPYARCRDKHDQAALSELQALYLQGAADSLRAGREAAQRAFGRDIPHVLLLHIGAFNVEVLEPLLNLLKEKGFHLVSVAEAEADAAYSVRPALTADWNGTLLDQMLRAQSLQRRAQLPIPSERLAALCR